MSSWIVSGTIGFISGGTLIWFCKTSILKLVIGANQLSAKLHAEADKISKI